MSAAKKESSGRFEVVDTQLLPLKGVIGGGMTVVLLDKETGVNYLFSSVSEAGGLTPLLDKDGKPVITHIGKELI